MSHLVLRPSTSTTSSPSSVSPLALHLLHREKRGHQNRTSAGPRTSARSLYLRPRSLPFLLSTADILPAKPRLRGHARPILSSLPKDRSQAVGSLLRHQLSPLCSVILKGVKTRADTNMVVRPVQLQLQCPTVFYNKTLKKTPMSPVPFFQAFLNHSNQGLAPLLGQIIIIITLEVTSDL